MADDRERDESVPTSPEMSLVGQVGGVDAASLYLSAAVMSLCGPVMLAFAFFTGAELSWSICGPGLRTFETTWKRTHHPALRVGLRLKAVVDPNGGRFRVEL